MATKLALTAIGVILLIPVLIAAAVQGAASAVLGTSTHPSPAALADILSDYLALYRQAATVCPGLDWSILAAIGKIETDHGRSTLPGARTGENSAGAGGPMQFLKPTFDAVTARHPLPPGGASPPSRYNPHDAIYAAAYPQGPLSGPAAATIRRAVVTAASRIDLLVLRRSRSARQA